MTKRVQGITAMALGLICLLGALGLTGYNQLEDRQAGLTATGALGKLEKQLLQTAAISGEYSGARPAAEDADMPTITVDGISYIGILSIPVLDISLPVISELSDAGLKKAPCLYLGTYAEDSMIIAGHNYKTHFGKLSSLYIGDVVRFSAVGGAEYDYSVVAVETVKGSDVEGMAQGEWDLTLFTCTYGGVDRVTVRCQRII